MADPKKHQSFRCWALLTCGAALLVAGVLLAKRKRIQQDEMLSTGLKKLPLSRPAQTNHTLQPTRQTPEERCPEPLAAQEMAEQGQSGCVQDIPKEEGRCGVAQNPLEIAEFSPHVEAKENEDATLHKRECSAEVERPIQEGERGSPARKKRLAILKRVAWIGFSLVLLISSGLLVRDRIQLAKEAKLNERLAQYVSEVKQAMPEISASRREDSPAMLPQYEALWKQNQDLGGWLAIEGTDIDYPVMYTPSDPEYYLRRAFDKSDAYSGSLFIGMGCSPDSSNVIIYGHNMEDKTMFSTLPQYQALEYAQAHPVIRFDTLTQEREYLVLAAFYSRANVDGEEQDFRYARYTSLDDPQVFADYLRKVKEEALYDTGVEAEYGDRLLTLSTCSYHVTDGRFVVVAVEREENEITSN